MPTRREEPLRVANIIEEARLGGPQIRMIRVAVAMRGRVQTLIFMPREASQRFRDKCDREGVAYRAMAITKITKRFLPALRYLIFSPVEILNLARCFRREAIDLVHVSGGSWQYKGLLAAKLSGKPVIWHLNDTSMPGFVRSIFRFLSIFADGFIFSSCRTKEYYQNLIRNNCMDAVVPPPIDCKYFSRRISALQTTKDSPVICSVGNINNNKGFANFISASAIISTRFPNARFQIIGSVYEGQESLYEKLVSQRDDLGLTNLSFVDNVSDVRPFLAECDVYVCASSNESWGMSLWEAMAMGIPVVSTDIGDSRLHIGRGRGGRVVSTGAPGSLADAVISLLENTSEMAAEGKAAVKTVSDICSLKIISEKTEEIYCSVYESRLHKHEKARKQ